MPQLGDFFPQHERDEYINRQLKPGQVLYLFSSFTNPPKEKYLVLVCSGTNPLLFVINSRISPFIERQPDLKQCQIKLSISDYNFLDHDSYVNCGEVIDIFDEVEIRNQIHSDLDRIKGELSAATKEEIILAVKSAKTISGRHKTLIINSLK